MALSTYSESQHWTIETHQLAATQLHWAFIPIIVFTVEVARNVFETKTQIRQKAVAQARGEGEERIRARLTERSIQLTPEDEQEVFKSNGHES